eukprot:5578834-Alexandrium_andersonii.AAC.1
MPQHSYPIKLFHLLMDQTTIDGPDAEEFDKNAKLVLDTPACVLDSYTASFVKHYPTIAAMRSAECRAELLA